MSESTESHILLADDDPAFRLLIERAISNAGFRVTCAEDGAEAVASALRIAPDLIFLDKFMPGVDGIVACKQLQEHLGDKCPPIIIVTSANGDEDIAESFAAGAIDYLVKPVNWVLFQHRLGNWLGNTDASNGRMGPNNSSQTQVVVTRTGIILELIEGGLLGDTIKEGESLTDITQLFEPNVVQLILERIRRALKTRSGVNEPIDIQMEGRSIRAELTIEVSGREKALVTVQPGGDEADNRANLFKMAYFDPHFNLPNRHLLGICGKDRLEKARFQDREFTILCFTVEALSVCTDGNTVLRKRLAQTIGQASTRLQDTDHVVIYDVPDTSRPTIANLNDKFFVTMIDGGADDTLVTQIADKIDDSFRMIDDPDTNEIFSLARVGVAQFPGDGDDIDLLVDSALAAAVDAMARGARVCRLDGRTIDKQRWDKDDREAELIEALEQGRIDVHYQPRVDLQSGRIEAVEALIRWPHPIFGNITAGELFAGGIGAAAVRSLSDWALEAAFAQAKAWIGATRQTIKVSVNLSKEQLVRPGFSQIVIDILERLNLPPALVELEVGCALLDCHENSMPQIEKLCDTGIGLIIDDFGSGSINLPAIRRLRIAGLKVDHLETCQALPSASDSGIYSIASAVSQSCKARLIAKNIECAEDLELAQSKHCEQAQGFHICQPLPAVEVLDYINQMSLAQTSAIDIAASI